MIKKFSELVQTRYHVTPKRNVKNILRKGLVPQIGERSKDAEEPLPAVYLFRSETDA